MNGEPVSTHLLCPACGSSDWLDVLVLARHGAPPDAPDHVLEYGHHAIFACRSCGAMVLEFREHDCFDNESVWDQYEWFWLTNDGAATLRRAIATCQAPTDPGCACPLHDDLRSSAANLPAAPWSSSLDAMAHLHRVTLSKCEGRLHWEPAS